LASLCQERHEGNIALVRSLKGTTYKELTEVVRSETVPPTVRAAFAQLLEHCHLNVAPLLPRPPVRYVRLKDDDDEDTCGSSSDDDDDSDQSSFSGRGKGRASERKDSANPVNQGVPAVDAADSAEGKSEDTRKIDEGEEQREHLRDVLEFVQAFVKKHTRPGGTLQIDQWNSGGGDRLMDQHWDPLDVEELSQGSSDVGSSSFLADSLHESFDPTLRQRQRQHQRRPSASGKGISRPETTPGLAAASSGTSAHTRMHAPPLSAMSKALQLTENLKLLGAVLSLLRLT
ncbi:unnamed protein product, partial [Ectocarpus sp. 12 AP-2014]